MKRRNLFSIVFGGIRGRIIQLLSEKPLSFSELQKCLGISSSRLNYHLKELAQMFVSKESNKYHLTETGEILTKLLSRLESGKTLENQIKIASIGMMIDPCDINLNIKEALKRIESVSPQGVNLVCLPFLFISKPIPIERATSSFLMKAQNIGACISFGLLELVDDKSYYSTILVTPDERVEVYRSIHKNPIISKVEVGNQIMVTDTNIGKIGLACGNEHVYPEFFRVLKLRGAEYVVCPTFGMQRKFQKIVHSIIATRAIENQMVIALSSSGFFRNEPFAIVCSPYQDPQIATDIRMVSICNVSKDDIEKSMDYFQQLFPRRIEMYKELVRIHTQKQKGISLFAVKKLIRRYELYSKDFVGVEEIAIIGKPSHTNVPMASYYKHAVLDVKKVQDVKWFDDFGPLEAAIINTEPLMEFLVPERMILMPGKLYTTGYRCKTSELINAQEKNVFLNFTFPDLNKIFASRKDATEEFEVQLVVDQAYSLIASRPTYSSKTFSEKGTVFLWRWIKPKRIPPIEVKLRTRDDAMEPNPSD